MVDTGVGDNDKKKYESEKGVKLDVNVVYIFIYHWRLASVAIFSLLCFAITEKRKFFKFLSKLV